MAAGCTVDASEMASDAPAEPATTPTAPPTPTPIPSSALTLEDTIPRFGFAIEAFWAEWLPMLYDVAFEPVPSITLYQPSREGGLPPCGGAVLSRDSYRDNAFWCEAENALILDDEFLLPELYEQFGDYAVAAVFAHVYAHAVQDQAGIDAPEVVRELQADCFVGAWIAEIGAEEDGLRFGPDDAREVVQALLDGRHEHASGFDRVSAVAQGHREGPFVCARYADDPPRLATIEPADAAVSGWFVDDLADDADEFWGAVTPMFFGVNGPATSLVVFDEAIGACGERDEFAAVLCPERLEIVYDSTQLAELEERFGRMAGAYPFLVARSQAVLVTVGADSSASDFAAAAECLTGAFLGDLFLGNGQVALLPGDLDAIVAAMVEYSPPLPDAARAARHPVLDRVEALRRGFQDGVGGCEVA